MREKKKVEDKHLFGGTVIVFMCVQGLALPACRHLFTQLPQPLAKRTKHQSARNQSVSLDSGLMGNWGEREKDGHPQFHLHLYCTLRFHLFLVDWIELNKNDKLNDRVFRLQLCIHYLYVCV